VKKNNKQASKQTSQQQQQRSIISLITHYPSITSQSKNRRQSSLNHHSHITIQNHNFNHHPQQPMM